MRYVILTHCKNEKNIRRFFVTRTQRDLYRKLENEIHTAISNLININGAKYLSRRNIYDFVEIRVMSLDRSKFKDFVNIYTLKNHLLDYCDIVYDRRIQNLNFRLPYRMFHSSEELPINKEKTCS